MTKAEDQLSNMTAVFEGVATAQDKTAQNQENLNELVNGMNNDPMVKMKDAFNNMMITLSPLLTQVAEFVGEIANWVSENSKLAATFAAVGTVIGIVVGAFALLMPAISAVVSLWPVLAGAIGVISAPVAIAIGAITAIVAAAIALWKNWDSVSAWLKSTWDTIKSNASSAFKQIKESVVTTWNQIKSAASSVWNGVKSVVVGVWNGIKGSASSIFNGIKSVISSVFNGIKSTVTSVWNTIKGNTTSAFNNIKSIISTVISTVKGVMTAGLQLITGNWKGAFTTLKTTASNMVSNITGIFKGTNLFQIGKDIISGLIRGIKNMTSSAIGAIAGVANGVINKAKSLLKINSPSKVFTQIGVWTGEGLANGIKSTTKLNEQVMTNITSRIKKATEDNAKEVTKIAQVAERERTAIQKNYAKKRVEEEQKYKEKITKLKKGDTKKRVQLEKELSADLSKLKKSEQAELKKINDKAWKDIKAKEAEASNLKLSYIKRFIQAKKEEGKLSLFEEAQYYRESAKQFKQNSKQQQEMQKSYQSTVEAINNSLTTTNEKYLNETKRINDDLIKNEEDLNKKYADTLESRYQQILGYYGLFDEVKDRDSVDGKDMIANLQDQVVELNKWRNELGRLEGKGLSDTLIDELANMGISALSQLEALNKMTDEELSSFERLYQEKMSFSRETAINELKPLEKSTQEQIQALRNTANDELTKLNAEWQEAIIKVVRGTDEQFTTLQQVGKNAANNLITGLSGMEDSLVTKAREIANSINKAINSALNITGSVNIGTSLQGVATSLSNSADLTKSINSTQIINNNANTNLGGIAEAINNLASRPIETTIQLDKQAIGLAISKQQSNRTNLSKLTKGVL